MLRNILAVIVGYIAMAILVGGGLAVAYLILGTEGAYKPGSYEVTGTWIAAMITVGIVAALAGGITCAKLSSHSKGAVMGLMAVVVALSVVDFAMRSARPELSPEEQIRTGEVAMSEAPARAVSPIWFSVANPIIGVVGIMLGATLVCPGRGNPVGGGGSED